ncbi:UNVERIFIED_ORG: hypothetical protein B5F06_02120 [Lacrimispora saccharolytica]
MCAKAHTFLYSRKRCSLLYKNAPRGSHWVGEENAAFAARRRRRILRGRILFSFAQESSWQNPLLRNQERE